jgi:hypothetical protein
MTTDRSTEPTFILPFVSSGRPVEGGIAIVGNFTAAGSNSAVVSTISHSTSSMTRPANHFLCPVDSSARRRG